MVAERSGAAGGAPQEMLLGLTKELTDKYTTAEIARGTAEAKASWALNED